MWHFCYAETGFGFSSSSSCFNSSTKGRLELPLCIELTVSQVSYSWVTCILVLREIPVSNSVDLDQTLRSAASDLALHCLPRSHLSHIMRKCVFGDF